MSEERQPERIEFEEELKRYYEARPFSPFDIIPTSGDRYEVKEPSQLAFGHSAIVLVLPRTGVHIVRKNQITAVHVHEPV